METFDFHWILSPLPPPPITAPVPVPTVTKDCKKVTTCTLTCEGNITGAEEVTYKWKSDDKELESSAKTLDIQEEVLIFKEISTSGIYILCYPYSSVTWCFFFYSSCRRTRESTSLAVSWVTPSAKRSANPSPTLSKRVSYLCETYSVHGRLEGLTVWVKSRLLFRYSYER